MSDIFAFDGPATTPLLEAAKANSVDSLDELSAHPWQGFGTGTGSGLMRGGAQVVQSVGMASGALLSLYERGVGYREGSFTDPYFRGIDESVNNAVDYWTPSAQEVGKAGQIVGGLAGAVLPLAAGGGNPTLLIASQELGRATDLARAGVSAPQAVEAGIVAGTAAAAGLKIPIVGNTLTSRLASGAAGNVLFGLSAREAENLILPAEQQTPVFDLASVGADALTGMLFGGLHHTLAPRIDPKLIPSQVDAILTARNAKSFQSETAPGTPVDTTSSVGHQEALQTALDQLSRSEPVDVSEAVTDHPARFADTSHLAESVQLAKEVAAQEPTDVPYAHEPTLTERFDRELTADPQGAAAAYAKIPESEGGKILNTDLARELSPDYRADRSLSADVHEPASAFIKRLYAQKLAEAPGPGEEPLVAFTAGGTGAGKSTGVPLGNAQIVYDTNLNRIESATAKIDQALTAGKRVEIIYTYREPLEALKNGALTRAMRQEAQLGSGRTVPLNEHIGTHVGSRQTIEELAAHYAGDDRVKIRVVDNSHGKGNVRLSTLAQIPKFGEEAYTRLYEEGRQILDAERAAGRISPDVHRGFRQDSQRPVGGPPGAADGGEAQPSRDGEGLDLPVSELPLAAALKAEPPPVSDLPAVAALQQLAQERPTAKVYTGFDADGTPIRTSLADAAEQIQREYEQDLKTAQAYQVAVNCFLGHGA